MCKGGQLQVPGRIARNLLCISFSAAEVERFFSNGAIVITPRRNRLGAEKQEPLMLAAFNLTREWRAAGLGDAGAEARIVMRRLGFIAEADLEAGEGDSDDE